MHVMSSPWGEMSWRNGRESVSVIAAMTIRKGTVSRVLLELREQHKHPTTGKPLAVEKAAAMVPVSMRQWQRWEDEESCPYLRNLEAVATTFGFPVSRFFDMDEEDGATTSMLSLEEIREEFRGLVADVNVKLDRILTALGQPEGQQLLEAAAPQLKTPDPDASEVLDALEATRVAKDRQRPAG